MPTSTYTPLMTTTLSSSQTSYTFTGLPTTYNHLEVRSNLVKGSSNLSLTIQVGNGSIDTGTNYSETVVIDLGSNGSSYTYPNVSQFYSNVSSNAIGNNQSICYFNNYADTSNYKSFLVRHSSSSSYVLMGVGTWRSLNAINQIKLFGGGSYVFAAGTTFTVYGIKSA